MITNYTVTYEELDSMLLNLTPENKQILQKIEQSIPSKFATSGPRRVCYFRNAHVLETRIKENLIGELTISDLVYNQFCYMYSAAKANNPADYEVTMEYFDESHDDFHGGPGTDDPDLRIIFNNISDDKPISSTIRTAEVKILYSPDKNIRDTSLHKADIIYELRYDSGLLNIYLRTGSDNKLFKLSSYKMDITDIWNPNDFPDRW